MRYSKKLLLSSFALITSVCTFAQDKMYKAGEVFTENIYQYGKIEVRMLAATGSGVISNFFTFKEGSELSSTFWEEIDIEVFGNNGANSWQTNLITGQGNTNLTRTEGVHQNNGLGLNYHTYAIEWTPTSVTWLIDDVITRQINDGQSLEIGSATTLRFNIWNPDIPEWVGSFDETILPVHMYVNWIKFYPWNGSSFDTTPSLEDNFDSFNSQRWSKANHTFAENQSDFIPENVNVVDGYLVLSITNNNETGYNDVPPIDQDETVLSITDFEDVENSGLTIFPNPSESNFNSNINEVSKIELFSTTGELVKTYNTTNFGEELATGVYIAKIYNTLNKHIETKKLIKE